MQKLQAKFKNIPRNASQVSCSTSSSLNKEEISSVKSKVLTCNNLDENLLQYIGEQNLRVSVCVCIGDVVEKPYTSHYSLKQNKKQEAAIPPLPEGRGFLAEKG